MDRCTDAFDVVRRHCCEYIRWQVVVLVVFFSYLVIMGAVIVEIPASHGSIWTIEVGRPAVLVVGNEEDGMGCGWCLVC